MLGGIKCYGKNKAKMGLGVQFYTGKVTFYKNSIKVRKQDQVHNDLCEENHWKKEVEVQRPQGTSLLDMSKGN